MSTQLPHTCTNSSTPNDLNGLLAKFYNGRFQYGGDYNPEQWSAEVIDEDIRLMQEANVNLVTVGVFSWALFEPEPDQYAFGWMREILDKLHTAGIGVDMATGTASPPAWLAHQYPETLPITAEGVRLGFGSRQQYCPSSTIVRERQHKLLNALANALADHPAIRMWHINNEYGCHVWECYCDSCQAHFRRWLQRKYTSIDALNTAWGTNFWSQRYTSFEQITLPGVMPAIPNPAQVLDTKRFFSDTLLELYLAEKEILRGHSDAPITTNFMELFPHVDYQAWAPHIDVISDDSYPDPSSPAAAAQAALEADLMRSLKQAPYLLMEQTTAAVQWRAVNSPKRPDLNALWSIAKVARGANGIMAFQWRQSVRGAETFHSAMVPHAGRNSRIFAETTALGEALANLDATLLPALPQVEVGILFSWDSEWARLAAVGPRTHHFGAALRAWHRSFFEAGLLCDVIDPRNPLRDLSEYKILIVPELFMADDALAHRLQCASVAGVEVLVCAPSGVVDKQLAAHLVSRQPLTAATGVTVEEWWVSSVPAQPGDEGRELLNRDPDARCDRMTRAIAAPLNSEQIFCEANADFAAALAEYGVHAGESVGRGWAESSTVAQGVEVIATFAEGGSTHDLATKPAITRRSHGDGGCWYLGFEPLAPTRQALVALLSARAGLTLPQLCDGIEVIQRAHNIFVLNYSDEAKEYEGRLVPPRSWVIY